MGTKGVKGVPTKAYFGGGRKKKWSSISDMTTITLPRHLKDPVMAIAQLIDSGELSIVEIFDLAVRNQHD